MKQRHLFPNLKTTSVLLQDVRYQKAVELVALQLFQEAARELQTLTTRNVTFR